MVPLVGLIATSAAKAVTTEVTVQTTEVIKEGVEIIKKSVENYSKINPNNRIENIKLKDFATKNSDTPIQSERFNPNDRLGNIRLKEPNDKNNLIDDKKSDVFEIQEKLGGSYKEVKKIIDQEKSVGNGNLDSKYDVHHMPAKSSSELSEGDGPAIRMEKEDHKQTASYGSSREAREYRAEQKKLIDQGKFREAIQMDIDDIHEKFGNKYDENIKQMLEYVDKLEEAGRV